MDSEVPPIPRASRERGRDRDNEYSSSTFSRRQNQQLSISTSEASRQRDRDVFRDRRDRERDRETDTHRRRGSPDARPSTAIPAASPEVISSLITSLAVISKPVSSHFDGPSYLDPQSAPRALSLPSSPNPARTSGGSFGVDYGAFVQSSLGDLQEEIPLDELAASAPVIRTAKPPSGFSQLTAPKSPRSPNREGSGLRSILSRAGSNSALNVSRPSSRGSLASVAESIGNVSIERGRPASPASEGKELRRRRSGDSWGKKSGRHAKGLMYMSSKERLREKEDKKRASFGATGGNAGGPAAGNTGAASRSDGPLAESVINEESAADSPTGRGNSAVADDTEPSTPSQHHPIPARDSSLRKTGSNAKRSSARVSRSKREGDGDGTIAEVEEQSGHRSQRTESTKRRHHPSKQGLEIDLLKLSREVPQRAKSFSRPHPDIYGSSPASAPMSPVLDADFDDGAPSPAVAQGRRRDRESSASRRRSGLTAPDALSGYASESGGGGGLRLKRSSSRLKRLSGAASPTTDKVVEPSARGPSPNIAYERPQSADSIDDAVESYLCSPRLSQKIRHPQTGRVISFSEVGDPSGSAVFCCVGMGLTRYITAFYDELALTLKLRLITPDRPGVGDSEAYAEGTATPLSWPDDVYAICQSLKITKFSILAHSAGAIYALATALRMPQHIRGRIHLLAPWIPPSQMSVFGTSAQVPLPPTNAIPTSQRILRALPTPILKMSNSSFMSATSSSITSSLPKQKRRREKKSNANLKEASKSGGGLDNKENHEAALKDLPPPPSEIAKVLAASEEMDRIRPTGASPSNDADASGHRHNRSNSSTQYHSAPGPTRRQSDKDEVILSAAAAAANKELEDRERQQTYDSRLTHAIWQLATTGANPAVDLLVCLERRHTIGFRYVDITRPVVIHHGSKDTRVPVENVRWLGKTMRRCEVRVLEGEGHGLMASAQVMGGVLMEVSREWEEWSRVTGQTARGRERERESSIGGERGRRGTIGQAR